MFPFVRPLNIHPPTTFSGGPIGFGATQDPYIIVPILTHDYEIYPEKKSDLAICVIPANHKAMREYEITRPNIKKYAEKCNADLVELFGDACPHWPLINKYRLSFVTLKYHRTLFLDVDIIINEDAPNIFDITPEDKFCMYDEMPDLISNDIGIYEQFFKLEKEIAKQFNLQIKNNHIAYNAGVMLIPNKLSNHYHQPITNKISREWTAEQMYLNLTVPDEDVFVLDSKFNHVYFKIDFWETIKDAYFIHAAGSNPLEYRLELLNRIKNKNYKPLLPPDSSKFIPTWAKKYVI